MVPSQILNQIRQHYCDNLRAAIADFVGDGIITMHSEAVLRHPDGSLATRGDPPTPTRVDLITMAGGVVREGMTIESQTMPSFPPFSLEWEHVLPVRVGPFPWNACDVRFTGTARDWSPLVNWFLEAFDPDEIRQPGENGLVGVTHSMTLLKDDLWQIDFGSAELQAFESLIDAMKRCGIDAIMIGKQ